MICENCGKHFATQHSPHVIKKGRPIAVTFCTYQCYLEFWSGCKNFEPLPEYIKPQNREETK